MPSLQYNNLNELILVLSINIPLLLFRNATAILKIRNNGTLFLMLAFAFLYCWIKFYAFYGGVAQGPIGSSQKGDFFFHLELFFLFVPVALFMGSVYSSIRISHNDEQKNKLRLFLSIISFTIASIFGVSSYEETDSFGNYYRDWHFFSDNFLLENLILFFISGFLIVYKFLGNFLRKRK